MKREEPGRMTYEEVRDTMNRVTKVWADKGMAIEGGWQAFVATALQNASPVQRSEMRKAFYLGAQHCFTCLYAGLNPEGEPSEEEMLRVQQIAMELTAWRHQEMK